MALKEYIRNLKKVREEKKKNSNSAALANDRLRAVISQDRMNLSSKTIEQINKEMINVLNKYVKARGKMNTSLTSLGRDTYLKTSISVAKKN